MRTYVPRGRDTETIEQGGGWFVLDASGLVMGRVATRGAMPCSSPENAPAARTTWAALKVLLDAMTPAQRLPSVTNPVTASCETISTPLSRAAA